MNSFFGVLSFTVNFIFTFFILHNFDAFTVPGLFQAVSSYHVQLPNLVLNMLRDRSS